MLVVYVDDIVVTGDDEVTAIESTPSQGVEIKTLGKLKIFLELKYPIPKRVFLYLNRNALLTFLWKLVS